MQADKTILQEEDKMAHDHDRPDKPSSSSHNGHGPRSMESRSLEAELALPTRMKTQPSPGQPGDDPGRLADDALMRCYNG